MNQGRSVHMFALLWSLIRWSFTSVCILEKETVSLFYIHWFCFSGFVLLTVHISFLSCSCMNLLLPSHLIFHSSSSFIKSIILLFFIFQLSFWFVLFNFHYIFLFFFLLSACYISFHFSLLSFYIFFFSLLVYSGIG